MSVSLSIRALACAALLLACHGIVAQPGGKESADEMLANLRSSLSIIEQGLERGRITEPRLNRIRDQVEYASNAARRIQAQATRRAEEQRKLLDALGPKPGDSEPTESERVASERKDLEHAIAEYQGQIKSANVILARADALRTRLAQREFSVLARVLSQRRDTPVSPGLIREAVAGAPERLNRFAATIAGWWQNLEFNRERFGVLIWWLVLLIFVVASVPPARNWILRRYGPDHRDDSPSFTRRFRVMLAVGLGNVVMPVVSVAGVYIVLLKSAAMTDAVLGMAWLLAFSIGQYFVITGLSSAAMSPRYPVWRINRFSNKSAIDLHRSIHVFACLVVVLNLVWIPISGDQGTHQFAEVLVMDVAQGALLTLFGAVAVVAISISMLVILRPRNWCFVQLDDEGAHMTVPPNRVVRAFFIAAKAGLVLSIIAGLIGYVNLAIFLSQRVVWCLLLIAFAYLLRAFIAAAFTQAVGGDSDGGSLLRDTLGYSRTGASRLLFWLMLVVDLALVVAVIVMLLLIWGVHAGDIQSAASNLIYGINIGSYTFSLVDLGVALGIFVVLLVVVRLFQGFLSNRVLAQTVPDVGVRDALTTGVGYTGIIIAGFVAISSLGLELSQLALIFGALSVGIGFGLQHVVNNFISGLILLMHRPVKAGDWIVVGKYEGYVRKINVVATEIQTFDNAEVIVPNSQLVTSEVLNWTHKSTVARVIVGVRVAYGSDPRRVHEILAECTSRREDILKTPAPIVLFQNYGDNGLMFEVRFFIKQADYMLLVASDLRFDIMAALTDAGITIPFPQRDIHIKQAGDEDDPGAARGPAAGRRHVGGGDTADGD